jgi:hypothetical protein
MEQGKDKSRVCARCRHFRNDPAFIEASLKGLSALSSAQGSVAAGDGLCLIHDRYLTPYASCASFEAAVA